MFAGQDKEATAQARMLFGEDHLPSSPSFAMMKDGKLVAEIGRYEIEGHDPMSVVTKPTKSIRRLLRRNLINSVGQAPTE